MSKADSIMLEGVVTDVVKGGKFKVKLDENNAIIDCTLSGKMRQNLIRILRGDHVQIEMSTYDLTKGRITWRDK